MVMKNSVRINQPPQPAPTRGLSKARVPTEGREVARDPTEPGVHGRWIVQLMRMSLETYAELY